MGRIAGSKVTMLDFQAEAGRPWLALYNVRLRSGPSLHSLQLEQVRASHKLCSPARVGWSRNPGAACYHLYGAVKRLVQATHNVAVASFRLIEHLAHLIHTWRLPYIAGVCVATLARDALHCYCHEA